MSETFQDALKHIARSKGLDLLNVFQDVVAMSACSLALQKREDEYLEISGKYDEAETKKIAQAFASLVNEMQSKPFTDILGTFYAEINSAFSRDSRGEFYTPPSICKLMAKVSIDAKAVAAKGIPVSIMEPALGSGGTILAVAEEFARHKQVDLMRVTGIDINKTACDMAYVNFTLWGIPAQIRWGDTLADTINKEWKNIHWARVGEDMRLQLGELMKLASGTQEVFAESPAPTDVRETHKPSSGSTYQMSFEL